MIIIKAHPAVGILAELGNAVLDGVDQSVSRLDELLLNGRHVLLAHALDGLVQLLTQLGTNVDLILRCLADIILLQE